MVTPDGDVRSPRGLTQSGRLHRDHVMEIQFHRNGPLTPWRGEVSLLGTIPWRVAFYKSNIKHKTGSQASQGHQLRRRQQRWQYFIVRLKSLVEEKDSQQLPQLLIDQELV